MVVMGDFDMLKDHKSLAQGWQGRRFYNVKVCDFIRPHLFASETVDAGGNKITQNSGMLKLST